MTTFLIFHDTINLLCHILFFFLKQYDDDVINLGRTTNRKIQLVEKLKTFFPDDIVRKSVKILDVAAGTGLVGVELKKAGFEVIHK